MGIRCLFIDYDVILCPKSGKVKNNRFMSYLVTTREIDLRHEGGWPVPPTPDFISSGNQ